MKKKYSFCLWLFLLPVAFLQAQEIELKEVTVYGIPTEKYAAGTKIYQADSLSLLQHISGNLADVLTNRTALYIKNYGNGMTSTIAFRGTSPNHTAILWNGFNINQPTLGQSDFSLIPLAAFEQLHVQYGPGSSLSGSDAIGGSIHLFSEPTWKKGLAAQINQEFASFNRFNTYIDARYSDEKIESKSSIYYHTSENNFPYRNTSRLGAPVENQHHSGINQKGFTQDVYVKLASNRYVALKSWYNSSDREVQPIIGITKSDETQQDRNLRLAAAYHQHSKTGYTIARIGFIQDILHYQKPSSLIDSRAVTNKAIVRLTHEININQKMAVSAGAEAMRIQADVDGYSKNIYENRGDIYALFRYQIFPNWLTTINIRQAFVQGYLPPLAPALGIEYNVWKHKTHSLTFKTNFSRSYRVPTLNERYWNPGGNMDLLPEDAIGGEAGIAYSIDKKNLRSRIEITHYQNRINHLIQWQPKQENTSSFWSPKNLQLVYSRGIEVSSSLQTSISAFQVETGLQYAYTKSTQEKVNNSNDIDLKGKQLMYVPYHNGVWFGNFLYKHWLIGGSTSYTGYRYTNISNTHHLDGFALVNVMAAKTFTLHTFKLQLSAKVNNILNTDYQTIMARAMPGRNYSFSLNFHFNSNLTSKP